MRPAMDLTAARGTEAVAKRLASLLGEAPADAPRLSALEPRPAPAQVAAVDGSSVTIAESGAHVLAAYRAGYVGVSGGKPIQVGPFAPEVVLLTHEDAARTVADRLATAGFPGVEVPRLTPSAALDALRTLSELETALDVLDALGEGDLLLLDGPLQQRPLVPLMDRLAARAAERRVDVVGVCKSTSLTLGPVPALVACQLAARRFPSPLWHAPLPTPPHVLGRTFAARLSVAEERAFRFDVHAHDGDAGRVLGAVAALCGHPAYPGYPSPLAMAHNAVLLNEETRQRLRHEVMEATLGRGVSENVWEAAFLDYHDILELGA